MAKKFVYWLLGEKAGRTIVGTWNWLWGIPVESGGKVAVSVAEESLRSMQESVQKLAEAVAMQVGSYERAKQKYSEKAQGTEASLSNRPPWPINRATKMPPGWR
jgi:phage shock protein A